MLSRRGPPEAVLSWVARMHESNVDLDVVAANTALKAYCSSGKLSEGCQFLTDMMRESRRLPRPDAVSFNTLIAALAQAPLDPFPSCPVLPCPILPHPIPANSLLSYAFHMHIPSHGTGG